MSGSAISRGEEQGAGRGAAPSPAGRAAGCLLGCTGWSIGLLLWSIATGRIADLWLHALGGFAASLSLGLLLLIALEAVERSAPAARGPFLLGGLLAIIGLIIHLLNVWIAPVIDAGPSASFGGVPVLYSVHPAVPWTLIVASLPAFAAALGRLRSDHRRASV